MKEIFWCAGVATQRSEGSEVMDEQHRLRSVIQAIRDFRSRAEIHKLRIFFASSAGGVYGDTGSRLATESEAPKPLDPYGESKLKLERLLTAFCEEFEARLTIGRLSSLYGERQNLTKAQGLLSHLAMSIASSRPLNIFTSLSSTRNYLDARTAARISVMQTRIDDPAVVRTRNICSPYNVSVAELVSLGRLLSGGGLRILQTGSAEPSNSRIATNFSDEVSAFTRSTLAEGLSSLVAHARRELMR